MCDFGPGDVVKICGEIGVFKVLNPPYASDGSVRLWGGDKDPNGHHGHRAVMPARVKPSESRRSRSAVS